MIYSGFAMIYDRLMQDVPYEGWIRYLKSLFVKYGIEPKDILDLGCGTGNVTIPLAEMGYRLTGLDMSAEMLSVAEEKSRSKGLQINWLQQDMLEMTLGGLKFDLVISMTDSLNYLSTLDDLKLVFAKVSEVLKPGGWLIFDLNSLYKLKTVFGSKVFTLSDEDVAYIWENSFDPASRTCLMDLTFFVREKDGRYRRFTEQHTETGYEIEQVTELLAQTGFVVKALLAEETYEKPGPQTERIYFLAKSSN